MTRPTWLDALSRSHPRTAMLLGYEQTQGSLADKADPQAALDETYAGAGESYWDHVEAELQHVTAIEGRDLEGCLQDLTLFNDVGAQLENDAWYDQRPAFVSMHLDYLTLGFSRRRALCTLRQVAPRLRAQGRFVEIGAGCGYFGARLLEAHGGWQGSFLDRSAAAAPYCEAYLQRVGLGERAEVVTGDITALPWPNGHFDLLVASEVVEHVADAGAAAAELARCLSSEGCLAVSVPLDLDIPMHPTVFEDTAAVIALFESAGLRCDAHELVRPAKNDAVYHALPEFEGCVHALFRRA